MRANKFIQLGLTASVLFLQIGLAQDSAPPATPAIAPAPQGRGPAQRPPDPRVQQRTYHFAETNEDLPYAIFVSSKVYPRTRRIP
jgi:hypothetical protein